MFARKSLRNLEISFSYSYLDLKAVVLSPVQALVHPLFKQPTNKYRAIVSNNASFTKSGIYFMPVCHIVALHIVSLTSKYLPSSYGDPDPNWHTSMKYIPEISLMERYILYASKLVRV